MKKILHELYYGRIKPWERGRTHDPESDLVNQNISDIKTQLKNTLPREEWKQIEDLEDLYTKSSTIEEIDAFSYGFNLGILLMINVLDFKDERFTDQ